MTHDPESGHVLTVGGLFSGIGGWELGLERAGMRVLWHCESDPYARAVLEQWWPGVPCYPDVRELRGADVQPVDVLCGGFPCQDLSYAGAGAGIDGARSGLWGEYARMVGELRPRYVFVENVAALLARGLGRVLGDLAALGYDAEWDCLPASAFGAPHQRDRLWLVAYPAGGMVDELRGEGAGGDDPQGPVADTAQPGLEGAGISRRPAVNGPEVSDSDEGGRARRAGQQRPRWRDEPADRREDVADPAERTYVGCLARADQRHVPGGDEGGGGIWAVEPDVGRVAHGVPARVDRLACLGNALVPQIAEWIGGRVIAYENAAAFDERKPPARGRISSKGAAP